MTTRIAAILSLPIADRGKDIQVGRLSVPRSGRETTESSSHVRRLESSTLATTLAKGREFSRERRHVQALGERELYVSFRAFLSRRARKTESNSTAPSRISDTTIIVSIHAAGSASISSIPASTSSFHYYAKRDTRDENRSPLRKYFILFIFLLRVQYECFFYIVIMHSSNGMETGSLKNNKDKKV